MSWMIYNIPPAKAFDSFSKTSQFVNVQPWVVCELVVLPPRCREECSAHIPAQPHHGEKDFVEEGQLVDTAANATANLASQNPKTSMYKWHRFEELSKTDLSAAKDSREEASHYVDCNLNGIYQVRGNQRGVQPGAISSRI